MGCCGNQSARAILPKLASRVIIPKNHIGINLARSEIIYMRSQTCRVCPHRSEEGKWPICSICSCIIKDKIKVANTICPDQPPRWDKQN